MGHPPREVGSLGFEPRDPSGFTEPGSHEETLRWGICTDLALAVSFRAGLCESGQPREACPQAQRGCITLQAQHKNGSSPAQSRLTRLRASRAVRVHRTRL